MLGKKTSQQEHDSSTVLRSGAQTFLRDLAPAAGLAGTLFTGLYALVCTALQRPSSITASTSAATTPDLEQGLGYALIIVGYLLVPGIAGLLVRRRKAVASQRALLDAGWGGQPAKSETPAVGMLASLLPRGRLLADVDRAAPKVCWHAEDSQCAVCLGDVCEGEEARVLPCGHSFHSGCADLWLVTGRRNCCPMCLRKVVEERDEGMAWVRR